MFIYFSSFVQAQKISLSCSNIPKHWLPNRIQSNLTYTQTEQLKQFILQQAENSGYPFAQVWLDSLQFKTDSTLTAALFCQKGKLIHIKDIEVEDSVHLSKKFIYHYLNIFKNDIYNEFKIKKIKQHLENLAYLKVHQVSISFKGDEAIIKLILEKKRSSRWDLLLGLQPSTNLYDNPKRRLILTGMLNADWQNRFGAGERITVDFQRLRPQNQQLHIALIYPYFLGLPFGADLKFDIYRQDSTYTDIVADIGIRYTFGGDNYLKLYWLNHQTNVQNFENQSSIKEKNIPSFLDTHQTLFGLEVFWQNLDYPQNPRRGWHFFIKTDFGTKNIRKNAALETLNPTFYDSLKNGNPIRATLSMARFFPFGKQSSLKIAFQTSVLLGQKTIFQQEQYRLGGSRLLRGFDESSIWATNFTLFTGEYRYLLSRNTRFYLYSDYAWVENETIIIQNQQRYLGLGAGLALETKGGIFNVSYAIGKTGTTAIDWRAAKIHFGYINYF